MYSCPKPGTPFLRLLPRLWVYQVHSNLGQSQKTLLLLEPQAGVEIQVYRFPRLGKDSSPQAPTAVPIQKSNDKIFVCTALPKELEEM